MPGTSTEKPNEATAVCTAAVLMKNRQYMHEVCCTVGMDRQLDYHLATDRSGTRRRNNTQRSKGLKELKRWRRESQWVASNSCMPTCGEKRNVRELPRCRHVPSTMLHAVTPHPINGGSWAVYVRPGEREWREVLSDHLKPWHPGREKVKGRSCFKKKV